MPDLSIRFVNIYGDYWDERKDANYKVHMQDKR